MIFCEQCGNKLNEGAKFCANCGASFSPKQDENVSAFAACAQCGAPLEEGEAFCANCGAKVGAAAQFTKEDDSSYSFLMEIEDVFTVLGRGTVVTGKIKAGSIKMNEEVIIIGGSQEIKTKVLFIEMFNKAIKEAKAGDNVGLVLHKVNKNDVKRGYIVTAKAERIL
jgi:translation elongation factor EF-Tu-like GTPase